MPRLINEKTVCIVVDIQERLIPALHEGGLLVEKCSLFLQGLNALSVNLLLTEQYPKGLGKTVPAVTRLLDNVPLFEKTQFSAAVPEVVAALKAFNAKHVILIGAEAHVCMLQTALDLLDEGFKVYVPEECTTSRNPANKANALLQMQAAGAVVSNIESLLFELMVDAKHPVFKTISKLIQ